MVPTYWGIRSLAVRAKHLVWIAVLIGLVTYNAATASAADSNAGPVRLARFAYVHGKVSWRPAEQAAWSPAAINLPVRQDAQIWVSNGSRAEIQFDDGSYLDMSQGAVLTLRTLYSDANGEFTELVLRNGTAAMNLRHAQAVYQIDAPFVSLDASGPARYRVDTVHGVQVAVHQGQVVVEGKRGKVTLGEGKYLALHTDQDTYLVRNIPTPDSFDTWVQARYQHEDQYWHSDYPQHLPSDIALVSEDLDGYGDWHQDPKYGEVWCPHVAASWRPYHDGHWVWVDPFGWTWVDDASWGWAPSHYGTWVDEPYGWTWVPGPAVQYWSPAVVSFCDYNGGVAWVPLAPAEVRYPPTLSIGIGGSNWSAFFSIGGAAAYYPASVGIFQPYPWSPRYVNRVTYINNVTTIVNRNTYFAGRGYVPYNARYAAGASLASARAFGGRGSFQALSRDPRQVFTRGRMVAAPHGSFAPIAGPRAVRPTAMARTPSRILQHGDPVSHAVLTRAVYRAPGKIQNFAAARRIVTRAPVAAAAHVHPTTARTVPGRTPNTALRASQAATAAQRAHQIHAAAPRTPAPALTREQRAAMQARSALGLKTGTARNLPGHNAAQSHLAPRTATAAAHHPTVHTAHAMNAAARVHQQRAAAQAHATNAAARVHQQHVATQARAAAQHNNRVAARVHTRTPQTTHYHRATSSSSFAAHRVTPTTHHYTATTHTHSPGITRYTPTHHYAAPSHSYSHVSNHAAPRFTPPSHQFTPQVHQPAARPTFHAPSGGHAPTGGRAPGGGGGSNRDRKHEG
jgi:hypothetical protein